MKFGLHTHVDSVYFDEACRFEARGDTVNAVRCLHAAACDGDSMAMNNLGQYYRSNNKHKQAVHYLTKAAEHGSVSALINLGHHFKFSPGKPEFYYKLAIREGSADAMNNLAFYYHSKFIDARNVLNVHGTRGARGAAARYVKLARKYYTMAVDRGHPKATYNLGTLCHIQRDYENMEKYYLMAINLHHNSKAMLALGCYYMSVNNEVKATECFEMFVQCGGTATTLYIIGNQFFQSSSCRENREKARGYFELAAQLGSEEARQVLKDM